MRFIMWVGLSIIFSIDMLIALPFIFLLIGAANAEN